MKLLIVEDEALCLESLKNLSWESVSIDEVYGANNAKSAIEKIRKSQPDIIITDIQMEDGDGFYLAEQASYILPNVKIIFLTAYDKFEYAHKAISYNAFAFILKPYNRKKLLQTVKEAVEEIGKTKNEQTKYEQLLNNFKNCKYFLKDYFFSALSQNSSQLTDTDWFPLKNTDSYFQVVIVSNFDKTGELQSIPFQAFVDILTLLQNREYKLIPFYDQNMLTFVLCWSQQFQKKLIFDNTFEATLVISNYMKHHNDTNDFTIGIGSLADGINMLSHSYQRATETLKYRLSLGENQILYIDDIEPLESSVANIEELKSQLIDNIKIGNSQGAEKIIEMIFINMKRSYTSIDLAQRICFELFIMISIAMAQLGQNPESLFNKTEIWSVLKEYQSLMHLKTLMLNVTELAISLINSNREKKNIDIINQAKSFIESNVEKDISLREMASRLYISPCYLSSLFKMKTNTSYKDYTISVKIKRAKELLTDTDLPIYEIATTLGYKSNQHFSHLFQTRTGLLPTEYRIKNRK